MQMKRVAALSTAVAFAALAIALLLAGGAPTRAAPGLPDAGLTIGWLVPTLTLASLLIEITLVGLALAASVFFSDEDGALGESATRFIRQIPLISVIWLVISTLLFTAKAAYVIGIPFSSVLNSATLYSFATQTAQGSAFIWQFFFVAVLMGSSALTFRVRGAFFALVLTLLVLTPPALQSHAAGAGHHGLALGAITVHVLASALWVSGVFALMAMRMKGLSLRNAVERFSVLALWCVAAIAISGLVSAWLRVGSIHGLISKYAALVLAKAVAFAILIYLGTRHRRAIKARVLEGNISAFVRLISAEFVTMLITVGLAVALAQTPTPIPRVPIAYANAELIAGFPMLPSPSWARLLWTFEPDGFALAFMAIAAILYFLGVRRLSQRGDHWPIGRSFAFAAGLLIVGYATSGGLGAYAHFAFSFHMIAHMTLATIAPIGIVLGAPVTLALRVLPAGSHPDERGARGTLNAALHSKLSRFYSNPVVALMVFDGSLFALYLTPLFGHLMRSHVGHVLMNFHFLAAGILFFYLIIGVDPTPRQIPHIVRIVLLFAAMSIHAFFSIAVMSTTGSLDAGYFMSLQRPWWTDYLADQNMGGGVGWSMGEAPIVLALIALFVQWTKDDAREARRLDRASDRAVARGEDDELAKYNSYLAELAKHDQRQNG